MVSTTNCAYSLPEIDVAAKWVLNQLPVENGVVIAIFGDLGAGKTTLIAAIVKMLGSSDIVQSPTFAIIHQYALPQKSFVYHMDWYRLQSETEAILAGVEDALYSGQICFVEWPGRFPDLLPTNHVKLQIEIVSEFERQLTLIV